MLFDRVINPVMQQIAHDFYESHLIIFFKLKLTLYDLVKTCKAIIAIFISNYVSLKNYEHELIVFCSKRKYLGKIFFTQYK